MSERYFIELSGKSPEIGLKIHRGDPENALLEATSALGPETPISDESGTLGDLVQGFLDRTDGFLRRCDERLQYDAGRHLYDQTLGQLPGEPPPAESDVRIHIVTEDEHLSRLPWVLLARSGKFLAASGWSVALSRSSRHQEHCHLPPSPKLLVAAPEPDGVDRTHAERHLESLELMLSRSDHHFERGKRLQVVTTWDDFREIVPEFQPDILYYYGHGEGDHRKTRLVFARDKSNRRIDVPVADVAQCLRQAERPPVLAYGNCCYGDAGGVLGAGAQLSDMIPAVVTNRTVAYVGVAQRQAMHFWRGLLLEGQSPHKAVAEMYYDLGNMDLGFRDTRWMTPVLHTHYDRWESHPPKPRYRIDDPHWHVKLDRVNQFSRVAYQTQKMLRNRKPPCLAYLWYGQEGQGVDIFHKRVKVELQDFLGEHYVYEIRPRWPEVMTKSYYYRAFEDMMLEELKVLALDDIPARIRAETGGEAGRDVVVYVRHEPLRRGDVFRPDHLKTYLEWWDEVFSEQLQKVPAFGLLGISFVVSRPSRFLKSLDRFELENLELPHLSYHRLDELEELTKLDLLDFLKTHNIKLPRDHKDQILDEILARTNGHYEMTLEELRDLVHRAWDERETEDAEPEVDDGLEDW